MKPDEISKVKDRNGWPIVVGAYVRVYPRVGAAYGGTVVRLPEHPEGVIELLDREQRRRAAHATSCVVKRQSEKARRERALKAEMMRSAGRALTRRRRSDG